MWCTGAANPQAWRFVQFLRGELGNLTIFNPFSIFLHQVLALWTRRSLLWQGTATQASALLAASRATRRTRATGSSMKCNATWSAMGRLTTTAPTLTSAWKPAPCPRVLLMPPGAVRVKYACNQHFLFKSIIVSYEYLRTPLSCKMFRVIFLLCRCYSSGERLCRRQIVKAGFYQDDINQCKYLSKLNWRFW